MNYLHTSFLCPKVPFLVALYILSEIIVRRDNVNEKKLKCLCFMICWGKMCTFEIEFIMEAENGIAQ